MQITRFEIETIQEHLDDFIKFLRGLRDQETSEKFISILDMIEYYLKTIDVVISPSNEKNPK